MKLYFWKALERTKSPPQVLLEQRFGKSDGFGTKFKLSCSIEL